MQRNCFDRIGSQNGGYFLPYQNPSQNNGRYPEIIGEGDVTLVAFPNGTIQYIFIPTFKRDPWTPYIYNPTAMNINWNLTAEAWLVRNVTNPIPPYCGQQLHSPYEDPFIRSVLPFDYNLNGPALGYSNKFHYDKWTSTTDIHCFYPASRHPNQLQKSSASVQIDTPVTNTVCHYGVVCGKPCHCAVPQFTEHVARRMSVDEVKETANECPAYIQTFDKSISTSNSQANASYDGEKEHSINRKNRETCDGGKRHKRKKILKNENKIMGICKSGCCCGSSCSTIEGE